MSYNITDGNGGSADRDELARHILRAGARPSAAAVDEARVRAAVLCAWRESLRARRRSAITRWAIAASVAAIAVAAALFSLVGRDPSQSPVGAIAALRGSVVLVHAGGAKESTMHVGEALPDGSRMRTALDGGARVVMAGAALTIAENSELTFSGSMVVRLQRGRIYVDGVTGVQDADRVRVITPFGSVEHLGTQFEVAVLANGLRVRVRDGQVRVVNGAMQKTLQASDELSISGAGQIRAGFLTPFSNEWAWTQDLATSFNIDGRTLREFLDWFAKQSGYVITYASENVHNAANTALLHGSIQGMSAQSALEVLIVSTNLQFELTPSGECRISIRP